MLQPQVHLSAVGPGVSTPPESATEQFPEFESVLGSTQASVPMANLPELELSVRGQASANTISVLPGPIQQPCFPSVAPSQHRPEVQVSPIAPLGIGTGDPTEKDK